MVAEDRRELDGEHADAAGAALDQHLLAGLQGRVVQGGACQAVSAASGSVAACSWETEGGLAARLAAGMATYSAAAPSRSKSIRPITSSPTARPATPSPRPATVPDIS